MFRRCLCLCLLLGWLCAGHGGTKAPLVAVECEHASSARGPVRLRRDNGASRLQCAELGGDGARLRVPVRIGRHGTYTVWVRAQATTAKPAALTLSVGKGVSLTGSAAGTQWAWTKLGQAALPRGRQLLDVAAKAPIGLDQLVFAGDPAHTPKGLADSSKSIRYVLPDVYFADDFMRSKREPGPWEPASGTWQIRELKVRESFDPQRSANAFSYLGTAKADAPAVALTGYPFWRNYSAEAALRSIGGGPFGLMILHQDAKNYYLLRFDPPQGRVELVRCLDGATSRLAAREGCVQVNQWYRVRLAACDGLLVASVDGHELFRAADYSLLDGRTGLWSADPKGAYFDDVLVRSCVRRVTDFQTAALDGWDVADGQWRAAKGRVSGQGVLLERTECADFDVAASLAPGAPEAGLVFGWRDAANHARLVLLGEAGRIELREAAAGKTATIASAPLPKAAKAPWRIHLSQKGGRVRTTINGLRSVGGFVPKAASGRVGLVAAGGPASFGPVELSPAQRPEPEVTHNRIFAGEETMVAWASAGSDWQVSTAGTRTVAWHEIEHWDDCSIRYSLTIAGELPGKLGLVVRGDGSKVDSGCQLVVEPKPKGPATFALVQGGKTVGTAKSPTAAPKAIELRWLAHSAAVFVDDQMILHHRTAEPPPGRRMAIWAEGWAPSLANTRVTSANVWNDYFEMAPCGWRAATGEWEMQNRWTCSPQWSWLGGGSQDAALLWTKRSFSGDLAVHYFGSFQMRKVGSRIYRPHNINVTICGDGRNPSSGYTFLYGGWNNTATALLRGEQVVARTTKTSLRPPTLLDTTPSTNYLHRKWWHIGIEKRGATVSCYVDDQLACKFTDPKPLDGGHVCLWTFNNAIMVARAWLAYQSASRDDMPLVAAPREPAPKLAPPPVVQTSTPALLHDFEAGLGEWKATPEQATVRLEARGKGLALAVTNPRSGGPFRLALPLGSFDAMAAPRLSFDYRLPADVRVNLHVTVNGRTHAIVLTCPDSRPAGVPVLGAAGIQADDAWHTADIDLRAFLLRAYPKATTLPVSALAISAPAETATYLRAGFGGNRAGATYRLDNVRLWQPGPRDVRFAWDKRLIARLALDRKGDTQPSKPPQDPGSFQGKGLADGTWYFHIQAKRTGGAWSRAAHIPFVVDAQPPRILATRPKKGSRSPAHAVTVDFADDSGIDPKSLASVSLLGKPYPVAALPAAPPALSPAQPATFDPVRRRLTVDLSLIPLALGDGQAVELALPAVRDFLGHKMAPQKLTWKFDRAHDTQPPTNLQLTASRPYLCRDDFEAGLGEWKPYISNDGDSYAIIERDSSTAASGHYSLRIHNPHAGGVFRTIVRSTPFDAGHYPLVAFDYKIPSNLRVDLILALNGTTYTVRFTDPRGSHCIGAVPGVQADHQWHHTEFNLHEILTAAVPKAPTYTITSLALGDTGFYGNADGVEYHIDNFTIAPAASTRTGPLEWKLAATDPSGIAAYQYSLGPLPAPVQWKAAKSPTWQFRNLGAGIFHFCVRARDGAGNWSKPVERKILVDDQPPVIKAVSPKAGAKSASGQIQVTLADDPAGINRDKTTLTVAGVDYKTTQDGVNYDARTHTLTWVGRALAKPVTFPNGQQVPCQLAAEDNVGNATIHKWAWKMDYSLDKTPPPEPYVARVPVKSLARDTFESDDGLWRGYSKYGDVARTAITAATGRYSLAVKATRSHTYFGAYAYRGSYNAATYPIISFDYCMPPGLAMNLHVHTGGAWKTIRLTSPAAYYTVIGTAPLKADGTWRHAEINLLKFLKPTRSAKTKKPVLLIRYVLFADFATRSFADGTRFHIDNFAIATPENGRTLTFEWTSVADPTGIAGYAYTLDKKPKTNPTKLLGAATTASFKDLAPGTWYLHLRTRDGAGNWGQTVHYPTTVTAQPAPATKTAAKPKAK